MTREEAEKLHKVWEWYGRAKADGFNRYPLDEIMWLIDAYKRLDERCA